MKTVKCKVEGMSCSGCVNNITRYLEKSGMKQVSVSLATGDVQFEADEAVVLDPVWNGIEQMGYHVVREEGLGRKRSANFPLLVRWIVCLLFTLPLLLHMWVSWAWLHLAWVQALLATPVVVIGLTHFGKSAWHAVRNGAANMDVLITISVVAGYVYSMLAWLFPGLFGTAHPPVYFEAPAAIVSFVLLGNWLEQKAVRRTASAVEELLRLQVTRAHRIDPVSGQMEEVDSRLLQVHDAVLIREGEQVPADGEIVWGEAWVNEALFTGESAPVERRQGDQLIGGTILQQGTVRMQVQAVGQQTVLGRMIALVQQAQSRKPSVQRLADRISAVFVPVVVAIAVLTVIISTGIFHLPISAALLRAMAVLVIACPCAMGLATPAAIMVGLGRAGKMGILIKDPEILEKIRKLYTLVFDKTGTLTRGQLAITRSVCFQMPEQSFRAIVAALEQHSTHPVARAIVRDWGGYAAFEFVRVEEKKGWGVEGIDSKGNIYRLGNERWFARDLELPLGHQLYLVRRSTAGSQAELLGWIDLADELRPEAREVLGILKQQGYRMVLLSGDRRETCEAVARELGIEEIYAEQTPEGKQQVLHRLMEQGVVAMVGDGINDAPALAQADISIAVAEASTITMQSASMVLLGNSLQQLPLALQLSRHTYRTIQENLLWALAYNLVAIPLAALGALSPVIAAFSMGFSDLVLVVNSLRLYTRKIKPA
ncbi:heavy metal translocating P-type ATPase [Thermoflavifilum thermophilum]|uniref:Cu+-exporting ATPase n=1 Tax=Thermoflavifilum thermophilum TaxID=1393122 RepID=A0A1I7N531_9BACT|nr:cation-translocating P-type ATPase [Thermoflavifilum thermophilum]SFV29768.1 Cu+-exporting ATPase [Thermoflavifilum thermophilum]